MKYFFDESGNWIWAEGGADMSGPPVLIMAGVALLDEREFNTDFVQKMKEIESKNGIAPRKFHSADLRKEAPSILALVQDEIVKTIDDGVLAVRALQTTQRQARSTQKSGDELYVEYASDLLAELAMGDATPEVFSDMKFNGAHPVRMAETLLDPARRIPDKNFERLMQSTCLRTPRITEIMGTVTHVLKNKLQHGKISTVQNLLDKLRDCDVELLHEYLFYEYWITKTERENIREQYRSELQKKLERSFEEFGITKRVNVKDIAFMRKEQNSFGVFVADFVCNSLLVKGCHGSLQPGDERLIAKCALMKR